jgi:hypothetical protein
VRRRESSARDARNQNAASAKARRDAGRLARTYRQPAGIKLEDVK